MKNISIAVLLAAILAAQGVPAAEDGAGRPAQSQATQEAVTQEKNRQDTLLKEIHTGVVEGMDKVIEAAKLLSEGKDKEALEALQAATGKFDTALAADPELALVPVDAEVLVYSVVAPLEAVREHIELARKLLDAGKVQLARAVLSGLRDELEISTVYLPMGTYPDAAKLAAKYLVDKKREEAVAVLDAALRSMVVESVSIPLGLVRARSLIRQASLVDREKSKEKALELVAAAREQLEIAKVLGYTDKNSASYDDLREQIENLEKEIKGPNVVEKLYEKLAASFEALIEKERSPAKAEPEQQQQGGEKPEQPQAPEAGKAQAGM